MQGDAETAPPMPVRRLHNYAYCPRLFYLQWVEGLFQENADTAAGEHVHRNVDEPQTWRNDLDLDPGAQWRSLEIESETLGLRGVVDLVEGGPDGPVVIDYKKGEQIRGEDGEWVAKAYDAVQVRAYALLLAEKGLRPVRARIYYAAIRKHVDVVIDDESKAACRDLIQEARAVAASGCCPAPPASGSR